MKILLNNEKEHEEKIKKVLNDAYISRPYESFFFPVRYPALFVYNFFIEDNKHKLMYDYVYKSDFEINNTTNEASE